MEPVFWAVLLLVIGLALIMLDIFLPSGALLSIMGLFAILAAVIVGFLDSIVLGSTILIVSTVILPIIGVLAVRLWPHTPIGRWILLQPPRPDDDAEADPNLSFKRLIGRRGRAKTPMLPSGLIVVEGRTYDATSLGMAIEPGHPVEIVEVRARRLMVRPTTEPPSAPDDDAEPLSKPIDTIGGDPVVNDPFA